MQSACKVGIDSVGRKVCDEPRQALGQDAELLSVAWATPNRGAVPVGVVTEEHLGVTKYTPFCGTRTPSSIVSGSSSGGSWQILRVTWVALLATFIFLRWSGFALTALVLGQLAQAAVEYRRVYGRKRASRRGPA